MINHKRRELEQRAGVHEDAQEASTEECAEFNSLADTLCRIHAVKAIHYGDYLKTHGDETKELFATQHFCDIKRKYVRAKTFIERMTRGETVDFHDLLDTYSDLAVYAVMGLQMAFSVIEKEGSYHGLQRVAPYVSETEPLSDRASCIHIYGKNGHCTYCGFDKNDDIPF